MIIEAFGHITVPGSVIFVRLNSAAKWSVQSTDNVAIWVVDKILNDLVQQIDFTVAGNSKNTFIQTEAEPRGHEATVIQWIENGLTSPMQVQGVTKLFGIVLPAIIKE